MPKFYTTIYLLMNQSKEIGEMLFSVFDARGDQNSPLMHIPLCRWQTVPNMQIFCPEKDVCLLHLRCLYSSALQSRPYGSMTRDCSQGAVIDYLRYNIGYLKT